MMGEHGGQGERERSMQEIAEDVGRLATEIYEKLDIGRELRDHPYRTLAIAAGVGYVLGGGLFTRATGGILRVGLRALAVPAFQAAVSNAISGGDEGLYQG